MNSNGENIENVILAWAKYRKNYVKPIDNVSWHVKDGTKFGRNLGNLTKQSGSLFESNWSSLSKLRPRSLEVFESPNPIGNFVDFFRTDDRAAKIFLNNLASMRVDDIRLKVEDICYLLEHADNLEIFEFSDADSSETDRILTSLRSRNKLKAINFQCSMSLAQIHQWMEELKFKLRLGSFIVCLKMYTTIICLVENWNQCKLNFFSVRFCGQPGFGISEFMKIRYEFPCVELLALQDFYFRPIDDENVEQIDPKKFFAKLSYIFPNLKMLYFDWRVVDTVCLYDERTISVCEELQKFYKNTKLQFIALLIYCPSDEMKLSVKKIQEYFEKANGNNSVINLPL